MQPDTQLEQKISATLFEMYDTRKYSLDEACVNAPPSAAHVLLKADGARVVVYMSHDPKLSVSFVKECIVSMSSIGSTHCIIVYFGKSVTPCVSKMGADSNMDFRIEIFKAIDLVYNITKHALVPPHDVATPAEMLEIAKHVEHLPKILLADPVVRFLGLVVGDVVKVSRRDATVVFRRVAQC